jgi:hypothetical protein
MGPTAVFKRAHAHATVLYVKSPARATDMSAALLLLLPLLLLLLVAHSPKAT